MMKFRDLRLGSDNYNILPANLPDHLRRNLLVSAAKEEALPSRHCHNQLCLLASDIVKDFIPVEIICHQFPVLYQINADQRIFQPQHLHDSPGGGSCSDQVVGAWVHMLHNLMGDGLDGSCLRERSRRLSVLGKYVLQGDGKVAVQPCVDNFLAVEILVNIQYLLLRRLCHLS